MENDWVELRDYPGYSIHPDGRILNVETGHIKRPSMNQQGISMVNLSINNRQYVRSVGLLVANTFLRRDKVPEHFDTPIHLDGDRQHCSILNLAWRPRWFAVRYHRQFLPEERSTNPGFRSPVILLNTEEIFPTSWDAAVKYGLLDREIFIATVNATYVFPFNYRFEEYYDA